MTETHACPECGAKRMKRVTEDCPLEDGFIVKRLTHYKCASCKARFFDDDAMRRIGAERRGSAALRKS